MTDEEIRVLCERAHLGDVVERYDALHALADESLRRGEEIARLREVPHIRDCVAHRCARHRDIPPLNANEFSGAECGACIEAHWTTIYNAAGELRQDEQRERIARLEAALRGLLSWDGWSDEKELWEQARAALEEKP